MCFVILFSKKLNFSFNISTCFGMFNHNLLELIRAQQSPDLGEKKTLQARTEHPDKTCVELSMSFQMNFQINACLLLPVWPLHGLVLCRDEFQPSFVVWNALDDHRQIARVVHRVAAWPPALFHHHPSCCCHFLNCSSEDDHRRFHFESTASRTTFLDPACAGRLVGPACF